LIVYEQNTIRHFLRKPALPKALAIQDTRNRGWDSQPHPFRQISSPEIVIMDNGIGFGRDANLFLTAALPKPGHKNNSANNKRGLF